MSSLDAEAPSDNAPSGEVRVIRTDGLILAGVIRAQLDALRNSLWDLERMLREDHVPF